MLGILCKYICENHENINYSGKQAKQQITYHYMCIYYISIHFHTNKSMKYVRV